MLPAMIGNAAVFGWSPQTLRASTLGEYRAALDGWNRAHGAPEPLRRRDLDRVRQRVAEAQAAEERRRLG